MKRFRDTEYLVTEDGQIYNERIGRFINQATGHWGYMKVHINRRQFSVHRIVAEVYLEKKEGHNIVNHIDNNPKNNNVSNLEWSNPKLNYTHSQNQKRNTIGEKVGISKLTEQDVLDIRELVASNKYSKVELAQIYKVHRRTIEAACLGRTWNHVGDKING